MNNIVDVNKEVLIEGGLMLLAAGYSCCSDASLGGSLISAGASAIAFRILKEIRVSCLESCAKTFIEKIDQEEGALDRTKLLWRMPAYGLLWSVAIATSGLFMCSITVEQRLYPEEMFCLGTLLGFSRYTIGALYNWSMPNQIQKAESINEAPEQKSGIVDSNVGNNRLDLSPIRERRYTEPLPNQKKREEEFNEKFGATSVGEQTQAIPPENAANPQVTAAITEKSQQIMGTNREISFSWQNRRNRHPSGRSVKVSGTGVPASLSFPTIDL